MTSTGCFSKLLLVCAIAMTGVCEERVPVSDTVVVEGADFMKPGPSTDESIEAMFVSTSALVEIACFCAAFAFVRRFSRTLPSTKGARAPKKVADVPDEAAPRKAPLTPLQVWRRKRAAGPVHGQDLQFHASRVFISDPEIYSQEFIGHLRDVKDQAQAQEDLEVLINVPAKAGRPELSLALAKAAEEKMGLKVEAMGLHRCMLAGYAASGSEDKVNKLLEKEKSQSPDDGVSARSLALVARGYLKNGKASAALEKLAEMSAGGHEVPSRAVAELFSVAYKTGCVREVFAESKAIQLNLPTEAFTAILEHCFQTGDSDMAAEAEAQAKEQGVALTSEALQSLLKIYVKVDEAQSLELFAKMKETMVEDLSEGFCRYIIARCADAQHLSLAESIADFMRSRDMMTFPGFKALMKVYAFCGEYGKACDLYHEIKGKGMAPDSVMLGSLLKFAAKAGRSELSAELSQQCDGTCVKNYMLLIRSAGQEGDTERALATFRKLQEASPELVDSMAFNVTLDALVANKEMDKANELVAEMQGKELVNIVTYNTLIKGYCLIGEMDSANRIIQKMSAAGLEPDTATFSSLLSGAAKALNYPEASRILSEMERRGMAPDSYVTSIMMQMCRKLPDRKEAMQALAIVDRPDIKFFDEEVVFNTVLDACIFRRDLKRLTRVIEGYAGSNVRASIRTYGLLIKGCAVLRRTQSCWAFWHEMVDKRQMQPNDVTLGCMIDALVEAGRIDEALALFQEWKVKTTCDTIIYSTLIKGFAQIGDADRAMALYRDMRSSGVQMNHIAFTTLINAHAKNGLMKRAEQLVEEMTEYGCKPNAITFSSLIRGHCVRRDLDSALAILQKMLDEGFEADCIIYNTLLDGCVQNQNWKLGDELLAEMKAKSVKPSNYTLSIVVKMWSKRGELDKAFAEVYGALKDPNGPHVDAQIGACIVGACIHNRNAARALEVFQDMKTWPSFDGPDANTYSAIISGLPRYGYLQQAVEITEEACVALKAKPGQDRESLAPRALLQLFRALKNERMLAKVGPGLAQKLKDAGMQVEDWWLE